MKKHSLSWWKKKADATFSRLVRLRAADENGNVKCYTCDKIDHWKSMQCGHYVPRNHLATRFMFENCRVQCMGCNVFKRGNYTEFAKRLAAENGVEILTELVERKNWTVKYSFCDYQEMIDKWTDELVTLENQFN